jgi:hypothetical protein
LRSRSSVGLLTSRETTQVIYSGAPTVREHTGAINPSCCVFCCGASLRQRHIRGYVPYMAELIHGGIERNQLIRVACMILCQKIKYKLLILLQKSSNLSDINRELIPQQLNNRKGEQRQIFAR